MSTAPVFRRFFGAAFLAVGFIIYGSLYPFEFHQASLSDAIATLLMHHQMHEQPLSGLIANILFYVPLGLFLSAAMARRPVWQRVLIPVVIGMLLSLAMETIQFYDSNRVTTATDVLPNVIGTLFGALICLGLTRLLFVSIDLGGPKRQIALLLIGLFLAYRLFPYVPTLDLHAYWRAVKPVIYAPSLDLFDIARYAAVWLTIALFIADSVGARTSRWLLAGAMIAVVAAKIGITHNHLTASELVALPFVFLVWQGLAEARRATICLIIAGTLAVIVAGERLLPFDWQANGHAFGWIPFASIFHGSMTVNTLALIEKMFLYTSLVWLLYGAGLRYIVAATLVASGLLATSIIETHLPGRSAEITDAVIAVLATMILSSLSPPRQAPSHSDRASRHVTGRARSSNLVSNIRGD